MKHFRRSKYALLVVKWPHTIGDLGGSTGTDFSDSLRQRFWKRVLLSLFDVDVIDFNSSKTKTLFPDSSICVNVFTLIYNSDVSAVYASYIIAPVSQSTHRNIVCLFPTRICHT